MLDIYKISSEFPKEEQFGLTSQIRRAAASIPTNIAEGCGRLTNKDFSHFLQISIGSASEVEYELLLAFEIGYISEAEYRRLSESTVSVRKMIAKYQSELNK